MRNPLRGLTAGGMDKLPRLAQALTASSAFTVGVGRGVLEATKERFGDPRFSGSSL